MGRFKVIKIGNHVKKLKVDGYFGRFYNSNIWHIKVELYDGRKTKMDTTGSMKIGEIIDELVSRLEERK